MRLPPAAVARDVIVRGVRWLRSDLGDAVRIARDADAASAGDGATTPGADAAFAGDAAARVEIGPGLDRWSSRLRRRRAAVVARRALLVVLALALVVALLILATGGGRPLWLLAALLLGPLAGLVALARAPSRAQTARVLDRGLGLHERLGTALELRAATAAPSGLGALVVDEATSALGRSLSSARAVGRRTTAEWAWVAALTGALGLAIAVPRIASSPPATAGGRGVARAAGAGASSGPGSHRRGADEKATLPARRPPIPTRRAPPPVGLDAGARGRAVNPYGNGYKGGHLAGRAQTHFSGNRQAGLDLAGPGGGASASAGGAAGGAGRGSAGARAGGGASSRKLTAGTGGLPQAANSRSASGARGASGARSGGGAPPGGESPGATRAGAGHPSGVIPLLGAKRSGLPLQAGFAPVHGHHRAARGGVSPQANGGGGQGRTATVGAAAGGAGSGGRFPVIAPTFNAPSPEPELLRNYFGGSNQLQFKGWLGN